MSETERYRVMVVAAAPILRTGLARLLAECPDLEVVAKIGDARRALEPAWTLMPDVVLLDAEPPGLAGVAELSRISRVIVLAPRVDPGLVLAAIRDGAVGYLLHGTLTADELATAIRDTLRHNAHPLAPAATAALVAAARASRPEAGTAQPQQAQLQQVQPQQAQFQQARARERFGLSGRETDVMDLIAQGCTNSDIAAELVLAEKSVKNYINRIYAKLGARNRATAIITWLGARPVPPDSRARVGGR
ncbi:LuxR C-terminal-related transcriptional regulator [Actinomadura sp. 9N407]|uniref:LuxR C-terminal-related transcriptional regulator n=1 Tax=Actinomadura sp. 9N407 TaxID=3375154 RepID=UPI00378ECE0F